ncbi:MAG: TIGR00730 family Rossman fold protein [Alphaproteobacteria bacterium]|nr:TIGR00730 family Rossman fold protein [Alphaproteobacteria bacterium]
MPAIPKPRSICVFCGSRVGRDPAHGRAAQRFGAILAAHGITLVYGGGGIGLMGVLADAVIGGGGRVVGVIPEFLKQREVGHGAVTDMVVVDSMHARKAAMFERADAFVILPGGLGTLDETMEIMTWRQLGLHDKPIVLVDVAGYWRPLRALLEAAVRHGFAAPESTRLLAIVDDVDQVLDAIATDAPATPAASARF